MDNMARFAKLNRKINNQNSAFSNLGFVKQKMLTAVCPLVLAMLALTIKWEKEVFACRS